mmetsp:Transcript_22512/g.72912  ORF Transcript_22512/g.72912 Transcript_22512/m.72912 type:complete len:235 (-) Transcript_22512:417-1121(-)
MFAEERPHARSCGGATFKSLMATAAQLAVGALFGHAGEDGIQNACIRIRPPRHGLAKDRELAERGLRLQGLWVENVPPNGLHPKSLLRVLLLGQGNKHACIILLRPGMDSFARHCEAGPLGKRQRQRLVVILGQGNILVIELEHVSFSKVRVVRKEPPIGPASGTLPGAHLRAFLRQTLRDDPVPIQLDGSRELAGSIHDKKTVTALRKGPDVIIKADFVVQVAVGRVAKHIAP